MPIIDDKVVAMSFESDKFEKGVQSTISALDKLKAALNFPNAGKGIDAVSKALGHLQLGRIGQEISSLNDRFNSLRLVALGVLSNIASQAVMAGARFAKAFTLGPLISGFQEYATNLNSIQTILANTQASGANLQDVNKALDELNDFSDKTIYNFSQMAKNIGTFTAAGVALEPAVASIKGIASLAALSGSNADQAATAMYQLSQAISAGRVSLMDWNSVVNAGMGGTVFQRALAQTAEAMGTLKKGAVELVGPMKNVSINGQTFRESMMTGPGKQSWLTSDVLTKTLAQFTGDLSDAELAAQGFSDAQIKAIQIQAKTAQEAATKVKTLQQVLEVAKETAGSGWAKTWRTVFGDFEEARTLFTNLSNAINGFINRSAEARNKVLGDWKALGGRTNLISAIKNVFEALRAVLAPIRKAFRDIFPAKTGKDLADLTARFLLFTKTLKPSPETVENLRRTFRGLFALLDIGKQIIQGIFSVFGRLFGAMGAGNGSFLNFTGTIGDFLVRLDEALKKGNAFQRFFVKMGDILAYPIELIGKLKDALVEMFSGFSPGGFSGVMDKVIASLSHFGSVFEVVHAAWDAFLHSFDNSGDILGPAIDKIAEIFQGLGPGIMDAIRSINVEAILQVIRTGLLAGLFLMFRQIFTGKKGLLSLVAKGNFSIFSFAFKNLGGALDSLTGSMQAMQQNIKAKTLKEIAIAIALLAASVVALSFVDPVNLNRALTSLAILFGILIGALKGLIAITAGIGVAKLPLLAAALVGIAVAIDLLTISLFALSRLEWEELVKGLVGIGGMLAALTLAIEPLSKSSARLVIASAGLITLGIAMNILAVAIRKFGELSLTQLAKGLIAVSVALDAIAFSARAMPLRMPLIGLGLIAVAAALEILADAVAKFGAMDWRELTTGLLAVNASLLIIADSMMRMPPNLPITAAGLILVSLALGRIAEAIKTMGAMSLKEIGKGLITLSIGLDILAASLHAMSKSVSGAVALGVAAAGIALLVPALVALGDQSWVDIAKGLIGLAGAFTIIGVAGHFISAAVPALIGFGAALLLIGGGLALAGAGFALVGIGLAAIAVSAPTAVAILIQALIDFTKALGEMGVNMVQALLVTVREMAKTAPMFVDAMVKIINSLLTAIIRSMPKVAEAFIAILDAVLKVLHDRQKEIIQAGLELILALLEGIRDHITELLVVAGEVVVAFVRGLGQQASDILQAGIDMVITFMKGIVKGSLRLIDAGADAVIKFLNGVADIIEKREPELIKAGSRIGIAIVKGIIIGLGSMAGELKDKLVEMAEGIPGIFKKILKSHSPSLAMEVIGRDVVKGLNRGLKAESEKPDNPTTTAKDMAENVTKAVVETFQVMDHIGRQAVHDLAEGLRGDPAAIRGALSTLNKELFDSIVSTRKLIKEEKAKLAELMKHPIKNAQSIKNAEKAIKKNEDVLAKSVAAHKILNTALADERKELTALSAAYNVVSAKLDAAQQALADAKQLRDDAFASFRDQYGELPSIDTEDDINSLEKYKQALKDQVVAVTEYRKTLNKLRKLGLDDTTYKKLLEEGVSGQDFADQLLEGGKGAVQELNKLDKDLARVSTGMARDASRNLYQAGVDAAQGFVNGLKKDKKELAKVMEDIAVTIVTAVKRALGIKSPSKIFAEIGRFVAEGLAKGIRDSSSNVTRAVDTMVDDAVLAMQSNLNRLSDVVLTEINPNPTITPILDLTHIKTGAKKINSVLGTSSINASISTGQAAIISARQATDIPTDQPTSPVGGASITFEQNNYSPKALDPVEIYRQTRSQIAQLRRVVIPEGV